MSSDRVTSFRLARHHLLRHASAKDVAKVAREIGGAQAQVLSAAQMAFWPRVRGVVLKDVESMIWKERTLVRAWCMRRTMYLLPSDQLAVFSRGSSRRAEREVRWVLSRGVSEQSLERTIDELLEALGRPLTVGMLSQTLSKSLGRRLRFRKGGGWGSRRDVPWIEVGGMDLPVGYLLHLTGVRGVICSGPARGNESTFVRADRWIPHWKDTTTEKAEEELLLLYLRAFGPASLRDFALWTGMLMGDAKEIWSLELGNMAAVNAEGSKGFILESDLPMLEKAKLEHPVVRLLPYFDSFLLGHRSHQNIVDAGNHRKVYRNAGWVSQVLLVEGRARGVWSHSVKKDGLHVTVEPFAGITKATRTEILEEVEGLGKFLSQPVAETRFS